MNTEYIALNYQERMDQINADTANEIAQCLLELEAEQDRLRYHVSLLENREAEVIAIRTLLRTGVVPSARVGRKYLVTIEALEAYLEGSIGPEKTVEVPLVKQWQIK